MIAAPKLKGPRRSGDPGSAYPWHAGQVQHLTAYYAAL